MMLTVEAWPVTRLIPYARNPRRNDEAVDRMCAAIREFGFRIPVVARSDGTVIDGHLRLKAAQRLGLPEVPVALADDLSEAQIKAFRLLANRSASWAEWDDELLALELKDLQDAGYDHGLTGFDAGELRNLMEDGPAAGLTDEDAVPEPPADPVTKPGDLWLLGEHRLLCGEPAQPTRQYQHGTGEFRGDCRGGEQRGRRHAEMRLLGDRRGKVQHLVAPALEVGGTQAEQAKAIDPRGIDQGTHQNAQQEQPSAPQKPASSATGAAGRRPQTCAWPCTPQAFAQQASRLRGLTASARRGAW